MVPSRIAPELIQSFRKVHVYGFASAHDLALLLEPLELGRQQRM